MPISAGLREDIAVYRGFIGQQYFDLIIMPYKFINLTPLFALRTNIKTQ